MREATTRDSAELTKLRLGKVRYSDYQQKPIVETRKQDILLWKQGDSSREHLSWSGKCIIGTTYFPPTSWLTTLQIGMTIWKLLWYFEYRPLLRRWQQLIKLRPKIQDSNSNAQCSLVCSIPTPQCTANVLRIYTQCINNQNDPQPQDFFLVLNHVSSWVHRPQLRFLGDVYAEDVLSFLVWAARVSFRCVGNFLGLCLCCHLLLHIRRSGLGRLLWGIGLTAIPWRPWGWGRGRLRWTASTWAFFSCSCFLLVLPPFSLFLLLFPFRFDWKTRQAPRERR